MYIYLTLFPEILCIIDNLHLHCLNKENLKYYRYKIILFKINIFQNNESILIFLS